MTRTAKAPRLSRHLAEPFLQIHPSDAAGLGLKPADLVRVSSPKGSAILRALITPDAAEGAPFAPMHWTGETSPAARIGPVIAAATDPVSGQPETKAATVALERFTPAWYGFAVAGADISPTCDYWARMRTTSGWRAELAGTETPECWTAFAKTLCGLDTAPATGTDARRSLTRLAFWQDDALQAALFISDEPVEVARDFVADALGTPAQGLLAARPGEDMPDPGPTVCSCMSVGRNTLIEAIQAAPGAGLDDICTGTGAGTSCGSCRPEVADLIQKFALQEAAE